MPLTVACAQFAPKKADVKANLDRIGEAIAQARLEGIDLLAFPEASTTGYFLEGGVLESSLTAESLIEEISRRLNSSPNQIDVALGFYEIQEGNLYNSAAYLQVENDRANLLHVYRKFFLPTYGVFDEERFVSRGQALGVFDSRFGRTALLICEDVWHSILPTLSALAGATILLVPSASPARGFSGAVPDNLDRYERLLRGISEEHGVFCLNPMLCGFEGGKGLVGGSGVYDPFGRVLAKGPVQEEYLLKTVIDLGDVTVARAQSPLISDLRSAWGGIKTIINSIDGDV